MHWDLYPSRLAGGRKTKYDHLLYEPLTYCGVTNYTGAWLARVKMSARTFAARITEQGLTPLEALSRPDRNGNCLKPLTDAELAEERKRQRKKRTLCATGGGLPGFRATVGTDKETIALGTFNSATEATYAINAAMTRLPEDWQPEDHWQIKEPFAEERIQEINRQVEEVLADNFPERFGPNRLKETEDNPPQENDDALVATANEA